MWKVIFSTSLQQTLYFIFIFIKIIFLLFYFNFHFSLLISCLPAQSIEIGANHHPRMPPVNHPRHKNLKIGNPTTTLTAQSHPRLQNTRWKANPREQTHGEQTHSEQIHGEQTHGDRSPLPTNQTKNSRCGFRESRTKWVSGEQNRGENGVSGEQRRKWNEERERNWLKWNNGKKKEA